MGNDLSTLTEASLQQMIKDTQMKPSELRRAFTQFKRLNSIDKGDEDCDPDEVEDLMSNPVTRRLFELFDRYDGNEQVQFVQFVATLVTLSDKGKENDKIKFAFNIFDADEDGKISKDELVNAIQLFESFPEQTINSVAEASMKESDLDGDGLINFEEFSKVILNNAALGGKITINLV
ncbi:calcineurin subunit B, putative [Entamoeba invadens IP1]|uniref:Calcineurin subunit B, putative n=1 Tax=Entamoeba invadens IP1 TaxID=370355 RepID=A0A0A1U8Z7_ENTIV|nr:calcineurin subunit B, putative [Entamoeba invadens IP1]ELP89611.1 calcineurin subunit B, putative [Entamoeba invadens IP1]|eukprot:XP_004256382.1 calcineurin subunit B, putative [Entamoeba invadens IP1]